MSWMTSEIDMMGGTIVLVSDQKMALEFYSQKLGFEIKENQDDWIEVRPKNSDAPISLVNPDNTSWSSEKKEQAKLKIGTDTGIWFYAKDIHSTYELLKSRGVQITKPEIQPWGVLLSKFYDQDKNEFSLLENPELIF